MKKYVKIAFAYAVAAMAFGVFYREFTKFNDFVGKTSLAVTHLHLFVLGSIVMLVLGLIDARYDISLHKLYKPTMILYNVALPYVVIMFTVRGVLQVVSDSFEFGSGRCRERNRRDRTCGYGSSYSFIVYCFVKNRLR